VSGSFVIAESPGPLSEDNKVPRPESGPSAGDPGSILIVLGSARLDTGHRHGEAFQSLSGCGRVADAQLEKSPRANPTLRGGGHQRLVLPP
jgi:hypothetical protein